MTRRRAIHLPGVEHKAPIPAAAVIGDMLFSSAINGKDPESGEYPDAVERQVALAFTNMRMLLEAAGGDVGDIAHVSVFLRDRADRRHVDAVWLEMFPDPDDRPARHALELGREGKALIQLEIIAVLQRSAATT